MKRALVFLLLLLPLVVSAQDQILGIMDLAAEGVSKADASILTNFVYDAAFNYGRDKYRIIDRSKRDALLDEGTWVYSDECDTSACAVEVGKLLVADRMIFGSFSKLTLGNKYYVVIQIVNVSTSEIEASARGETADYDEIAGMIDTAMTKLFGLQPEPPPQKSPEESEEPLYETEESAGKIISFPKDGNVRAYYQFDDSTYSYVALKGYIDLIDAIESTTTKIEYGLQAHLDAYRAQLRGGRIMFWVGLVGQLSAVVPIIFGGLDDNAGLLIGGGLVWGGLVVLSIAGVTGVTKPPSDVVDYYNEHYAD